MAAHSPREVFIAKQDPLVPSAAGLQEKAATTSLPLPKKLIELRDHLDAYAGKLATSPEALPVLDLPGSFKFSEVAELPTFLWRWPYGLYIPGSADYKEYGSSLRRQARTATAGSGCSETARARTMPLPPRATCSPTPPRGPPTLNSGARPE